MKRTLLFILAFLPMLASADAIEIDGIYYNLDREAKTAEVTSRPNQYESDVAIPESVTYNVVVYSVTSIGDGAFRWCSGLTSVTIPNSVTFIGQWAFYNCSGLTSITIPSSVTSIGELAFSGCSGLTSVTIPNSVKTIGESAFNGCENLSSVTIANGVTSIGVAAFQLCTSLTSLTIPSSVTAIAEGAFEGCSGLQSIVVDKGNTVYDSREDCNAIIKTSDNELISGCTNSTIPNSVTKIGQSAFKNCKGLRSVRIPNSVVSVGQFAFQGCSGMTSITIPNSVTSIGSYAFRWCSGLTSITIPDGVSSIDEFVFYGCTALQSIEVEDGNPAVCSVDGVLFNKEKTKLLSYPAGATQTSYTVPESVTWIEPLAFSYSQHLRVVTLTDYVTELGYSAFYECKSLEEVRLPSGLKTLANYLFGNCQRLKSVTIPQGVTYLGLKAFYCCTSLTSVTMPESITSTDYSVFEGCTSLESVTLSPNLSKIEYNMFANCSSLKKLLIPNSVTMVGSEAFKNCSALTSLDLPKSINRLGYSVFAGCKLNSLYIRGVIDSHWMSSSIFTDMDTQTELYVLSSEMEKFQAIYKGPIYPLPQMSNDVMINETTFPDSNFRNWVLSQDYGSDGVLTKEELENVTSLDISRMEIYDLKGIEYFKALKDLKCISNKFTTLDLSGNTALKKLECGGNRITTLNLSRNTALEKLDCGGCKLTTINLSRNKELRFLSCVSNSLTTLDISGCTELDTLACSSNHLKELDLSTNTKLIYLQCHSNQLTTLDLSKNTALRRIHCNANRLTTLDVSKNTELNFIECSGNLLTTLDVTKSSALTYLSCMNNKLTTLYVSNNKSLEQISCFNNQLTSLDASGCSSLDHLGCYDNQLTTLNLSGCSALKELRCYNNLLTTLDLSDNTSLTKLYCIQNQIKGTGMDALVESLPTVSEGSLVVIYSKKEQNVMTTTQVATAKAKGWTPYIWTDDYFKEYAGVDDYRPMIEDGKVWKVGSAIGISDDIVKMVDYYYFDGDTIINGKTCKQMMFQRYVSPDYLDYDQSKQPSLDYVGAWYEEDKKVYLYYKGQQSMRMMYDFSLDANTSLLINNDLYLVGPRQTEGLEGFKGIYRDVMFCANEDQNTHITFWLEGVGGIMGPGVNAFNPILVDPQPQFLMSCTVGDEVIYLNDKYEDGATPTDAEAKKHRFDFTHTIKTKPKTRGEEEEQSLYGEYNNLLLGINLNPLDDTYLVRITNESDQVVYEKNVNAGNIVGLNIDISAFAKGRYTVTMENSGEVFTGEFETITTGIQELINKEETKNFNSSTLQFFNSIYNLQGQRLNRLQKGLNIVNGRKVLVK